MESDHSVETPMRRSDDAAVDDGRLRYHARGMDPLLTLSGVRLAQMIRAGETRSREVVDAHIRQIERANPVLNAVVRQRFAAARAEADAADAKTGAAPPDTLPPLHGVP